MWYRVGYFVPDTELRAKGTHRANRWCIISGPHYKRQATVRSRDLAEDLASTLAKTADYEMESVISVHEDDLPKYHVTAFPWLLIQSTFWGKKEG